MTSGNVSDEPIAYRDDDALERLGGHRRPVPAPRPADPHAHGRLGRPRVAGARAARPAPLARLRAREHRRCRVDAARPLLACGAELKSTFCVAKGGARLGRPPHRRPAQLRDAASPSPRASRTSSGCSRSTPEVVAHDLHPDYLSTRYALERDGRRARRRAAPPRPPRRRAGRARRDRAGGRRDLRRHRATAPTAPCGAASCWSATCAGFERAGHLRAGAAAGRRPRGRASRGGWRARGSSRRPAPEPALPPALAGAVEPAAWRAVAGLAASGLLGAGRRRAPGGCSTRSPRSAGCAAARDATRGRRRSSWRRPATRPSAARYQIELRRGARARPARGGAAPWRATSRAGVPVGVVAARFHNGLADATAAACARRRATHGVERVVLSGGVFQNRVLLERTRGAARARRAARARARARCRPATAASPTVRRPSPPRAADRGARAGRGRQPAGSSRSCAASSAASARISRHGPSATIRPAERMTARSHSSAGERRGRA